MIALSGGAVIVLYLSVDAVQQGRRERNRIRGKHSSVSRNGRFRYSSIIAKKPALADQIQQEEADLQQQIEHLQGLLQNAQSVEAALRSTEELLQTLRLRLEELFTSKLKRQVIEALIERIVVNTIETAQGKKEARITVIYRFGASLTF